MPLEASVGTRVIRGINIIVPFLLKASIVFLWRRDTMARVPLTIIGWLILRRTIIGVPTFNFSLCGGSEPIFTVFKNSTG